MTAHSTQVVLAFCDHCSWAHEAWTNHYEMFGRPDRAKFEASFAGPALARLSIISQEYTLLQLLKLHDNAVVAGRITLGIDYMLTYGGWRDPVRARLDALRETLDNFATPLRVLRNKELAHNDLEAVLSSATLGEFAAGGDVTYFAALQEFVNVVHDEAIGGPRPFKSRVKRDVSEFLARIDVTPRGG